MPDDESMLARGTVDFRNEERMARHGRTLKGLYACTPADIDESAGMADLASRAHELEAAQTPEASH